LKEYLFHLFEQYPQLALIISLLISIVVAILGLVPSVFITAANVLYFGFWQGMMVSFLGEAVGAIIAFFLYRKGFKKNIGQQLQKFPKLQRLLQARDREAFLLILSLRLIPFVPSGLVTFAAAMGRVSALTFLISSSLGKLPALLMEAYSVYQVTQFGWQGKLILIAAAMFIFFLAWKQIRRRRR